MSYILKLRCGRELVPCEIELEQGRLYLKFRYKPELIPEIKSMEGARWDPNSKRWHVTNSPRNLFVLSYLSCGNPYAWYERPLIDFKPRRDYLMGQQLDMAKFSLTYQYCIFACEMGTGKTLAIIETLEQSGTRDWWYCAPRNAIFSVKNEFKKWALCDVCLKPRKRIRLDNIFIEPCTCPVFLNSLNPSPRFLSYEELRKEVDHWPEGRVPPQAIVYDECSRGKNPTSQRSQAMLAMANAIRAHWDRKGFVVEMSGSPAPKDPTDWWQICEIAQPGYLKEGDIHKFKNRLCVIEQKENPVTGGTYPHLVTWLDDPKKCKQCGQIADHPAHNIGAGGHAHVPSIDEVSYLYRRMNGLVLVKLKKDCMQLPDKVYEVIELEPTNEMKRAASIIEARCATTIQALTLLRELSDGFQYQDEDIGEVKECERCHGSKVAEEWVYCGPEEDEDTHRAAQSLGQAIPDGLFEKAIRACDWCSGTGTVPKTMRKANEVPTPKEAALQAQLDLHEDVGRLVVFGGFTGSIDRITAICKKSGWHIIRVDGRGWDSDLPGNPEKLLEVFQEREVDKIVFIGQPGAAGLGLNLTASPTIVYWSNDFNAESRIQSEDRIHRKGMDLNLGAKIIDLICLRSDFLVLNNLQRKRRLQDLTLGQMREEIAAVRFSDIRVY